MPHHLQEKPPIEELQAMVDSYLPGRGIKIEYAPLGEINGIALLDRNIIQVNLAHRLGLGCSTGYGSFNPVLDWKGLEPGEPIPEGELERREKKAEEKAKLSIREHYILTTLHEITHFLFPPGQPLPKWIQKKLEKAKEELGQDFPKELADWAWASFDHFKNPNRVDLFLSYLHGEPNHIKVHNWSWRELQRLRKRGPF